VHNFDIGDDYFSTFKIQFDPSLTLSFSTGVGINTAKDGPRAINNASLTLIKLWPTARLSAGMRRGMTGSLGVSGPSQTSSVFGDFNIRLTQDLTGIANMNYSYYDTEDVNFSTAEARVGLQYRFTQWLSSYIGYGHRFQDGGSGASDTVLRTAARLNSNSVFVALTGNFDVWPTPGLAKQSAPANGRTFGGGMVAPPRPTENPPVPDLPTQQDSPKSRAPDVSQFQDTPLDLLPQNRPVPDLPIQGNLPKSQTPDASQIYESPLGLPHRQPEPSRNVIQAEVPSSEKLSSATPSAERVAADVSPSRDAKLWAVQVASFPREAYAEALVKKLRVKGHSAYVLQANVQDQIWYRVRVGDLPDLDQAKSLQAILKSQENLSQAYIVRH
jgi:cell division septation protein DedD